jgi:hypothetical protein
LYQAYYNEPYDLEYHFEISKLEKDLGEMKWPTNWLRMKKQKN